MRGDLTCWLRNRRIVRRGSRAAQWFGRRVAWWFETCAERTELRQLVSGRAMGGELASCGRAILAELVLGCAIGGELASCGQAIVARLVLGCAMRDELAS